MIAAILNQLLLKHRVGEVCAVPSKQVVHLMQNADSQVCCIHDCFGWQSEESNQVLCQRLNLWNDGQLWDALQEDHPAGSGTSITT